ncbi:MAG: biotin/lipoyl-containing protein, partial [Sphingorhabdus sp.]|uniref:biotin/lipoyl-containing protein n=1 Tax=Sphingorhabdus sp. TaxID=1902408 RepID=UPI003C8C1132
MSTEVKVPTLGESITEATLGQWLKKPGEAVAADEPIASLETDKVAVEVPAPAAGVMGALMVKEGDTVNVGAVIAMIEAGSGAPASAPVAVPAPAAAPAPAALAVEAAPSASADLTLSPAVRRLVLELGIDPTKVKGSGKDGRLTKEDVLAAAKGGAPAAPAA